VPANEEHDNAMVTIENEDDVNENDTKHHETNENSGKQETQTKLQTIDPPKLKRSESAFSKVSNVSVHAHNSTLSSKVFLLEENLKRLQNIVGSLIPQVDANNNVTAIHDNFTQYRERSTSMGLRHEQVKGSKVDSGHTTESMSEGLAESALKRPVTQPVVASENRKPEFPRSKTTGILVRKNKPLIRQGSMPLKLKPRQFVPTIHEEVQQGEHGIEEVTKDNIGTQGEFGKEEARHDKEDKEDTQGEAWIDNDVNKETQPNEGMKIHAFKPRFLKRPPDL
jgi:hypothetical protein